MLFIYQIIQYLQNTSVDFTKQNKPNKQQKNQNQTNKKKANSGLISSENTLWPTNSKTNFLLEDDVNFVFLSSLKDHLESTEDLHVMFWQKLEIIGQPLPHFLFTNLIQYTFGILVQVKQAAAMMMK